jgi:hypothetical protein
MQRTTGTPGAGRRLGIGGIDRLFGAVPPQVRRRLLSSDLAAPPELQATYQGAFRNILAMIGMMYRAGIPIEDGAGEMPGISLHRELELDVEGYPSASSSQQSSCPLNCLRSR